MKFRQKTAYSILEVIIAIWLLVFAAGSLIVAFAFLASSASVSSDRALAELLADELMERAVKVGPPSWDLEELSGTRTVDAEIGGTNTFDWTLIPHETNNSALGSLYKLEVVIDWTAYSDGVERGKRTLTRVRHVYVESK